MKVRSLLVWMAAAFMVRAPCAIAQVPYTFANQSGYVTAQQLDANFSFLYNFMPSSVACTPFEQYGGSVSSPDNTNAWQNWVSKVGSTSACLQFQSGTYTFASASPLAMSLVQGQTIALRGASMSGTLLKFTNGGGFAFTYNSQISSVHVRELTAVTARTPSPTASTTAFSLSSALGQGNTLMNTFINVGCRGADSLTGGTNNYWNYCIYDNNVPDVAIVNPQIWGAFSQISICPGGNCGGGTGIYTVGTGTGTGPFPAVINIYGGDLQNLNVGINFGPNTQGMMINSTTISNDNIGIISNGNTQLSLTNSELDTYVYGIQQTGDTDDLIVQGNLIFVNPSSTGVYTNNGERMTIGGNSFVCFNTTATTAININATDGFNSGSITGNSIRNCNQGVTLGTGSTGIVLGPNSYFGNNTKWANSASIATNNSVLEIVPASVQYNGSANLLDFTGGTNGYRFDTDVSVIGSGTNVRLHADNTNGYLLGNTSATGFNSHRPLQWNLSTGAVTIAGDGVQTTVGGVLAFAGQTFISLPTCTAGSNYGTIALVNDASAAITGAHQQVTAGGASNKALVACNGSGWFSLTF